MSDEGTHGQMQRRKASALYKASMSWPPAKFVQALSGCIITGNQTAVLTMCEAAVQRGDVVLRLPNEEECFECAPLLVAACGEGQLPVVRCLCELPESLGVYHQTKREDVLCSAATHGHTDVVRYLCELPLERGVEPGRAGNDTVRAAAAGGHLDIVRYLCELPPSRGVNPGDCDNHALRASARAGFIDVVRYLCELPLDRGVHPGARDNRAVVEAAAHGRTSVVQYLCELPAARGVDPSVRDNIALARAAMHGHVAVVRCLCELPEVCGVGAAARTTAMHRAVQHGCTAVVRYLCELPPTRGVALAAVHSATTDAVRMFGRVAPRSQLTLAATLRFVVLELPGGDLWLDSADAARWAAGQPTALGLAWLAAAVQRRSVWRRRRCLLLLRGLTHMERAHATRDVTVAQRVCKLKQVAAH